MLIFCDFIQVYIFSTNHHLKLNMYHCNDLMHIKYGEACFESA